MIISGGVNILSAGNRGRADHPSWCRRRRCIRVPNEEMGEEVKAVVQRTTWRRRARTEAELIVFCRKHLSPIQMPQEQSTSKPNCRAPHRPSW